MNQNITAVVRGFGERTEGLCIYLLQKYLPKENIFLVNESPSTEGTRAVYNIGLREGRKYTLFVDADQLLFSNAIPYLYDLAEMQREPFFGVKGCVIDKLFLELRGGGCGPILYNTFAFEEAITMIPDPTKVKRTDSLIINYMKHLGYNWIREMQYTAYHDYEQYYRDIYKKMVINTSKMADKCKKMIDRWDAMAKEDNDYAVCIQGWLNGHNYENPVIDYTQDFGYIPLFKEKKPITDYEEMIEKLCLK